MGSFLKLETSGADIFLYTVGGKWAVGRKWACLVAFSAESCDTDGWEGQAGSFQSHSRVWPLSGALHFGRGGDSHTHTHTSHGECFKYQEGMMVSRVCVCEKAVERRGE